MRGGAIALLALSLWIYGCATIPQTPPGPPPSGQAIEKLIYEFDKAERSNPPCPEVYRQLFKQSLETIADCLAEIARERARH